MNKHKLNIFIIYIINRNFMRMIYNNDDNDITMILISIIINEYILKETIVRIAQSR